MKRYVLSWAASVSHVPEHPERTAKRTQSSGWDFDVTYQVWPNRKSLAKSIRMQEKGPPRGDHWRPCVPLSDGEGY